jgi:hypothetical protein
VLLFAVKLDGVYLRKPAEIKVILAAFPLSHSSNSYFRERKDRVTPAATAEIIKPQELFVDYPDFV